MANAWRIAVAGWTVTIVGWYLMPIIAFLLNKFLSHIGFDASRKLRELDIHTIPKMKQTLRDIEEQRMQRKARKERSSVSTLDKLAKDVKSALYQAEDILDLIDYHQIEKNIIGVGECEVHDISRLQHASKAVKDWVAYCKRSWLGRCLSLLRLRILYPLGRLMQAALHKSAALLPISHAPSVSFMPKFRCWCQSILIWAADVINTARNYRNWSYEVVVGITSYQVPLWPTVELAISIIASVHILYSVILVEICLYLCFLRKKSVIFRAVVIDDGNALKR